MRFSLGLRIKKLVVASERNYGCCEKRGFNFAIRARLQEPLLRGRKNLKIGTEGFCAEIGATFS
jgi:hypothetical protein